VYVDADPERAREMAYRYIGDYYHTVMKHYRFHDHAHEGVQGYEYYAGISRYIDEHGTEGAAHDFADLMPWGTPDQVLERLAVLRDMVGMSALFPWFSYAGMPPEDAESSLRLFAGEVLPVVQSWDTDPLPDATPRRPVTVPSGRS
jgi:hypothetical protein